MKKILILTLFALLASDSYAASCTQPLQINNSTSFIENALVSFLSNSIKYPEKARQQDLQGNSIVLFTLHKGKLSYIHIQSELGSGFDIAVLNQLLAYPNLQNQKDGKYAIKTEFRLRGSSSEIQHEQDVIPAGYLPLKVSITAMLIVVANRHQGTKESGTGNLQIAHRGAGSGFFFTGLSISKEPKVIVDGEEIAYQELKFIVGDQIKSMTVLKGDSAIMQYGPSAAYGAIVITTKNKPTHKAEKKLSDPKPIKRIQPCKS